MFLPGRRRRRWMGWGFSQGLPFSRTRSRPEGAPDPLAPPTWYKLRPGTTCPPMVRPGTGSRGPVRRHPLWVADEEEDLVPHFEYHTDWYLVSTSYLETVSGNLWDQMYPINTIYWGLRSVLGVLGDCLIFMASLKGAPKWSDELNGAFCVAWSGGFVLIFTEVSLLSLCCLLHLDAIFCRRSWGILIGPLVSFRKWL